MPIAVLMMRRAQEESCGCVVEVYCFSWEERGVTLQRLHAAFAAGGCWVVEYRRRGRRAVEYSFDVELDAVMELYCGLLRAGVEMTEGSHRAMTELCVLRRYGETVRGVSRLVALRLVVSFPEMPDEVMTPMVVPA